jgi:hypothetical protein
MPRARSFSVTSTLSELIMNAISASIRTPAGSPAASRSTATVPTTSHASTPARALRGAVRKSAYPSTSTPTGIAASHSARRRSLGTKSDKSRASVERRVSVHAGQDREEQR